MNMPAKRPLRYVTVIAGAFLVLVALCAGLRLIPASRGYSIRAEFAELPANDRELEQWLRDQSGVADRTVHVRRDGQVVFVSWIMTQNLAGNPRTPDLETGWQRKGYSTPTTVDWAWRDK